MGAEQSNETYMSTWSDESGDQYWADFESKPFSAGAFRHAFKGHLHGRGPRGGDQCVVKVFKKEYAKHITDWTVDVATSKKAQSLATKFNEAVPSTRPLKFMTPMVAKMEKRAGFKLFWIFDIPDEDSAKIVFENEYVCMEPFLTGTYQKFNANNGWVNPNMNVSLIPAFSHWTWAHSGGKYLVCDIQGVRDDDEYLLTDPAIHSDEAGTYGNADLGSEGVEAFFSTHKCTEFCKNLHKPRNNRRPRRIRPSPGTTYGFTL
ncbi:eukaryotic elongation factor 2 kinase [Lingula anatina]|uniref:Eukaryotic elongation factor 2 kinase n=1 Tax=Lingula anatina TaxID=7574 RepID=A0A1S3IF37_LINAN|nr:eukaryotic elongation factor 2 kinase [Lingula anatina]|eukprot:XP_013396847.1 eukaryotic elongation factor 2 kinase [Lingula anatina]